MCGIFSVIASSKETTPKLRKFNDFVKDAAIFGLVRGEDSTGMFQVRRDSKKMMEYKLPYNGYIFSKDIRAGTLMSNVDVSTVTVGHHRAATKGSICLENTHPFRHKVNDRFVIGVHNGGIHNASLREDDITFDVDSDWAMYKIAKHGGAEAIGMMNGAMAFVWYENDGKIRLYTNGKRPLHFAFAADADAMMIMSEDAMLYALANRNEIDIDDSIMYPSSDKKILVFDPDDLKNYAEETVVVPKYQHAVSRVSVVGPYEGYYRNYTSPSQSQATTHQGMLITNDKDTTKKNVGLDIGEKVMFSADENDNRLGSDTSLRGTVTRIKEGLPEVIEYGLIVNITPSIKRNIIEALKTEGQVECNVIGSTRIYIGGTQFAAAVLTAPTSLVFVEPDEGDDDDAALHSLFDHLPVPCDIPGPDGRLVSRERFLELTKEGCASCTCPLTATMAKNGEVDWLQGDVASQPLCITCSNRLAVIGEVSGGN